MHRTVDHLICRALLLVAIQCWVLRGGAVVGELAAELLQVGSHGCDVDPRFSRAMSRRAFSICSLFSAAFRPSTCRALSSFGAWHLPCLFGFPVGGQASHRPEEGLICADTQEGQVLR